MYEPLVKKSRDTGLEEGYQPYGAFVINVWNNTNGHFHFYSLGAIPVEDAVKATHRFIESRLKNIYYTLYLMQAFEQVHEAPYRVHWGPDGEQVWSGTYDWFKLLKQKGG